MAREGRSSSPPTLRPRVIRAPFFDRFGDAVAGALILTVGAAVRVFGI